MLLVVLGLALQPFVSVAILLNPRRSDCLAGAQTQLLDYELGVTWVGLPIDAVVRPLDHPVEEPDLVHLPRIGVGTQHLRLELEVLLEVAVHPLQLLRRALGEEIVSVDDCVDSSYWVPEAAG